MISIEENPSSRSRCRGQVLIKLQVVGNQHSIVLRCQKGRKIRAMTKNNIKVNITGMTVSTTSSLETSSLESATGLWHRELGIYTASFVCSWSISNTLHCLHKNPIFTLEPANTGSRPLGHCSKALGARSIQGVGFQLSISLQKLFPELRERNSD